MHIDFCDTHKVLGIVEWIISIRSFESGAEVSNPTPPTFLHEVRAKISHTNGCAGRHFLQSAMISTNT